MDRRTTAKALTGTLAHLRQMTEQIEEQRRLIASLEARAIRKSWRKPGSSCAIWRPSAPDIFPTATTSLNTSRDISGRRIRCEVVMRGRPGL